MLHWVLTHLQKMHVMRAALPHMAQLMRRSLPDTCCSQSQKRDVRGLL